ncbi:MAG: LamG domain-containing protein, partial [Lentisphaerae bacterium]|nr:LamG domain-containing protein [Lentisphaerota bacterium]
VKIPELTRETSIYAFWGKEGVSLPVCTANGSVWIDDYLAVWHLNDATDTTTLDSTAHSFNGEKGAVDSPKEVVGKIGKCQLFNKSHIKLLRLFDTGQIYTVSMWINGSSNLKSLYPLDVESGRLLFGWGSDTAGQIGVYDGTWKNFGSTPSLNTWHHVVYLCQQDSASLFLNGEQYGSTLPFNAKPISGQCAFGSRYSYGSFYFPGMLDEVRISTKIRSSDWIWASWQNQGANATFNDYGAVVSQVNKGSIFILR